MNGDGKLDIVVPNGDNNDVVVFLNQGNGTFAAGQSYFAGYYPEAVAIADIFGNGKPAVLSVNDDGADVSVLANDGHGVLTPATRGYATGGWPWTAPVIADFNGDGKLDLAVADDESTAIVFLAGRGDGTFRSAVNYYPDPTLQSDWSEGYTVATFGYKDSNGNNKVGLVMGMEDGQASTGVRVYLPNADGSCQPPVNYGFGGYLQYVAVGDFNGDGKADIAASDTDNGVIQIFTGKGDGTFNDPTSYQTTNNSPGALVAADLGRGKTDLVVYDNQAITILLNDGQGGFAASNTYGLNGWGEFLAVKDVNGDTKVDIVAVDSDAGEVAVLLGNGDGTFQDPTQTSISVSLPSGDTVGSPIGVALGDFNGDGKVDLALTLNGEDSNDMQYVAVLLNNGDWSSGFGFGTPVAYRATLMDTYSSDSPYPIDIRAVDINGDGKLDLVYSTEDYGTIGILYGKGDGTFYDTVEYPVATDAYGLAVADLRGDGILDIVVASYETPVVSVLSQASVTFTPSPDKNSVTVTAGESGTFTITVTPGFGLSGLVTFSCVQPLPTGMSCTFNPASVMLGSSAVHTTLTVSTTGPNTAHLDRRLPAALWTSFLGFGTVGCVLLAVGNRRRKRVKWAAGTLLLVLALLLVAGLVGCSSSHSTPIVNPNQTSTGTHGLQVQIQYGNTVKLVPLQIVVQ